MKFELEDYHRNTPDNELIADLKRIASELKKETVTIDEYNERGKFHSTTLARRFGNWFLTLEKAGLKKTRNLHISEEEYFRNLEEVWTKLGRQPRYLEMQKPLSKYVAGAYAYKFGTWRKALEKFIEYVNKGNVSLLEKAAEKKKSISKHKTKRSINWRLRFLVMRKDKFKCKNCGRSPATDQGIVLHVDHIKPWANGGETVLENLQTLCSICNIGKSNID